MTLTTLEKLNIIFRSKVIKEMTIEDLEIWKGFNKIYPSYLRFPETVEFNQKGYCERDKTIKYIKLILKRVDKIVLDLIYPNRKLTNRRSKEITKYLEESREMLNFHLKRLNEIRNAYKTTEEDLK